MKNERTAEARAHFDVIAKELKPAGVATGSLFGKPALKIGTRAFACQFRDGVAFKLSPDALAQALELTGAELFDPSGKGRPMREWGQVPVDHAPRWLELARQALLYVGG